VVRLTYEDYAALPADGRRWELIDGELELSPAPSPRHQTVSRRLQHELMAQLEDTDIALVFNAPVDLILSPHDIVQPDLVLVRTGKNIITERAIEGLPDVVVEILSPSSGLMDKRVKRALYARFGVPEYWLVEPQVGSIEICLLRETGLEPALRFDRASRLTSPAFPEIDVNLEHVFRSP
jgi:Uma2 family endonuclease